MDIVDPSILNWIFNNPNSTQ